MEHDDHASDASDPRSKSCPPNHSASVPQESAADCSLGAGQLQQMVRSSVNVRAPCAVGIVPTAQPPAMFDV